MKLIPTDDGSHTIYSETFGVSYHSKHGAIDESRHVFIEAGLNYLAKTRNSMNILEIGFGSGLNAFMTYLEGKKHNLKIKYTGVEAFPVDMDLIQNLNYVHLLDAGDNTNTFQLIHDIPWDIWHSISPGFIIYKELNQFQNLSQENVFDLVYFDAFAPNAQPELWNTSLLSVVYRAMRENGILVTYCAQGQFKRNLKELGFVVESIPGPSGKRQMTRAIKKIS